MARHVAEFFPTVNGANFEAEWKGSTNQVGFHNATEYTFITQTGVTGAVEVAFTEQPAAGDWKGLDPAVTLVAAKATTLVLTPAVKAARIAGVAAANPPPVRLLARLDV